MKDDDRFEADLRSAMAPEAAGAALRRRILEQATEENRKRSLSGWLSALGFQGFRFPMLVELGALAAAASLAVGVFAGASGLVLSTTGTTTVASNDTSSTTVDLVALAYEDTSTSGGLQ